VSSEEEDNYCSAHTRQEYILFIKVFCNIDISETHDMFGLHHEVIDHMFTETLELTSFDKDGPVQYDTTMCRSIY